MIPIVGTNKVEIPIEDMKEWNPIEGWEIVSIERQKREKRGEWSEKLYSSKDDGIFQSSLEMIDFFNHFWKFATVITEV